MKRVLKAMMNRLICQSVTFSIQSLSLQPLINSFNNLAQTDHLKEAKNCPIFPPAPILSEVTRIGRYGHGHAWYEYNLY